MFFGFEELMPLPSGQQQFHCQCLELQQDGESLALVRSVLRFSPQNHLHERHSIAGTVILPPRLGSLKLSVNVRANRLDAVRIAGKNLPDLVGPDTENDPLLQGVGCRGKLGVLADSCTVTFRQATWSSY